MILFSTRKTAEKKLYTFFINSYFIINIKSLLRFMKKFFALLFVCAGLTAMAGAPQFNKADMMKSTKGQMVMKANTLSQDLTAPVMKTMTGAKAPSSMKFINSMRPSIANNKMVRKGAPRRLSNEDLSTRTSIWTSSTLGISTRLVLALSGHIITSVLVKAFTSRRMVAFFTALVFSGMMILRVLLSVQAGGLTLTLITPLVPSSSRPVMHS